MDRIERIPRCDGPVDWDAVPTLKIDRVLWLPDAGIRAEGQLCYDGDGLYVHMRATEKNIRATYTKPLSPVFCDSCLEFFFMIEGDENYFNFEINFYGCMTIQYGNRERIDIVPENNREYFAVSSNKTEDGWEVFYRIPLKFIRMFHRGFTFDRDILVNMYKCGNYTAKKHFLSWMPVDAETPDFHRPESFGRMTFEREQQ